MSGHLIGCVKGQNLAPSHKLALLAFADSADDRTHIGFAGYEGVQAWTGCSRARAAKLIKDLVEWGLLKRHKTARPGQRAEYVVFPAGCCDVHRTPAEEPPLDLEHIARAAGVDVERVRQMFDAMARVQLDAEDGYPQENGSTGMDTSSVDASTGMDPFGGAYTETAAEAVDNPGMGPQRVSESRSNRNAFTSSNNNSPLPPPASRQGRCPAHPNGRANCRFCGTTPRQIAAAAKKAAADQAAGTKVAKQLENRVAATERKRNAAAVSTGMAKALQERARLDREAGR
ncbi:hypothetical protein Back2_17670 [Nocardioides baekrokdamisoli]|uniref:Helix-turn-helix domain-containing protein n=1 Tax=Nocardioides baekrokdamisoli TaxID=1804624 RepID=A0A3G9IER5_9ACTN|nr:hypothetical protein [Nocardioides baekrokdamisoli]BBH17480.1 hypothetical protein Back2_17670 [Nocardioides baekrokdamisoli]